MRRVLARTSIVGLVVAGVAAFIALPDRLNPAGYEIPGAIDNCKRCHE